MRTTSTPTKTLLSYLLILFITINNAAAQGSLVKTDIRLYQTTTNQMLDAAVVVYDPQYSNAVDGYDALKFSNGAENLGIRRAGSTLVVEARQPAAVNDDIPLSIWGLQQSKQYTIEVVATNMGNATVMAVLQDGYLNTTTPLNLSGTTRINFNINSTAASYALDRFKVLYVQAGPLPVRFTGIAVAAVSNGLKVEWKVADELNIDHYEIERSFNGRDFSVAGTVTATGNSYAQTYTFTDGNPASFYRVKSVGRAGDRQYSAVAKAAIVQICAFGVSPNPSRDGVFTISINSVAGKVGLRLVDAVGRVVKTLTVNHAGGSNTVTIALPAASPAGMYRLLITAPDNTSSSHTLMLVR